MADLDEPGVRLLAEAVGEVQQERAWTNVEELLASLYELLGAILSRLEAGIPVVPTKRTRKVDERDPYPRPEWVKPAEPDEVVVTSPAEAIRIMRRET